MVRPRHDAHLRVLSRQIDYNTFANFRRHTARVRLRRMISTSPPLWFILGFGTACILTFTPKADSYKDGTWCRRRKDELAEGRKSVHKFCLTHPMARKAFEEK